MNSSLSLAELIWVGYPSRYARTFGKVFEHRFNGSSGKLPLTPPQRWVYETYRAGRPAEMAAVLQQEASIFLRQRIDDTV
jgi:hypothetical protein